MKRNTSQSLIPIEKKHLNEISYDIYPSFPLVEGRIELGYEALANVIQNIAPLTKVCLLLDPPLMLGGVAR